MLNQIIMHRKHMRAYLVRNGRWCIHCVDDHNCGGTLLTLRTVMIIMAHQINESIAPGSHTHAPVAEQNIN